MSEIPRAAKLIAAAAVDGEPIVAFTGAGISQESGIPTFRGAGGIWREHDPEQVATLKGFRANPAYCWTFHVALRAVCREAAPNPAHLALAWIERAINERASAPVITQNIDGLHQAAGSRRIIELHGSCHRIRCTECDFADTEMPEDFDELPPICECGALLRPDVVLFGEQLPREQMSEAQRWCESAGVMLVIGTSATVQPAASLPVAALRAGAAVVEVNYEPTALSPMVEISLRGPAAQIMPELAEAVGALLNKSGDNEPPTTERDS